MNKDQYHRIPGKKDGIRIESRVLEEQIQEAVDHGQRYLEIVAYGQHGIGGRLWKAGNETVNVRIVGPPGQRVGAMGFPNTRISVMGPASDDTGWLNAGAQIVVHGNAGNGTCNAMAQGRVYVAGNIGARGMTMTKQNPRFDPPELWVLGSAGDYFGEFMAGGIAVICGWNPQTPDNVLGYRPLVGMVGGKVFFRGPHKGFSRTDAKQVPISDEEWRWLRSNLKMFLERIDRTEILENLDSRDEWQLITTRSPQERMVVKTPSMASFREEVWDRELGKGGLIGDLTDLDRSPIPLIPTGDMRRFVPVWENRKYAAPCEASCPTGIPVQERWRLIREGRVDEAVDLALTYTPFPATVCGYLCPNLCMQSCTRTLQRMPSVDVKQLGRASIAAGAPELPPLSGRRIAVIGGGPAGISTAWQLRLKGHEAILYDTRNILGGKVAAAVPESRLPAEVLTRELERIREVIPHIHLRQELKKEDLARLREDFDYIVIATGAQKPRTLPIPGKERMMTALEFLTRSKDDPFLPGERVIVIGAGNVGCDVATEAHRLGARDITLIDVQKPLAFGKEKADAEAVGARFRWPCFTREITGEGVVLDTGEVLPADTVFIAIGDAPDVAFLPDTVRTDRGYVVTDESQQTTDPRIFAIGDIVRPGLITDAIGAGRRAALAIDDMLAGKRPQGGIRPVIDTRRITLEYFDPRLTDFENTDACGSQCASCGTCRDCGMCATLCPQAAITREEKSDGAFEYVVNPDRCIGCGFCANGCPCGIWSMMENTPIG
ncbi:MULTISPECIES: FAD-dependent oxidoreductase [Desulfococcus]|jgi:NADPH-dependent glutamate synthase beta subunit-like oxidoreductase/glutamate synthase domain-containing protein 3/Pyruvate/2-oxoacid:ferredoxin oxidoreductase delta subunit|uniref:Pyridine nucleotide-disulfide oxidoreductase, FAD/NAD(P)-binding domain containing protein n=1 Tax=Desulfococcus multivorans DSM 2059 TaxID=1121405 RepID=S7UY99_DESML|nr:FAD-dependent oxidoreductase [Desulfococcus multivorans]AOY60294.1 glutamate synthase (NADPH), GltB1 subunit [Desulfococcus multivorans]AQV02402.1 pyridine nucleotide-disulfide oxidoreductase [Desulfococcus multivorans]EPR39219.1 Pyridine nucleotide-disulfide oxidoreductase, FAD/NAD(P)-binding domain containing protein [Desulfococcus multivorans DSM 2059]SJZ58073.1 glutamate synthase (NADPH) GltB3 subunit [Desulfococcus multivorans DSM 2059]